VNINTGNCGLCEKIALLLTGLQLFCCGMLIEFRYLFTDDKMDLIPIVKTALTIVISLGFLAVFISYIVFKIKGGSEVPQEESAFLPEIRPPVYLPATAYKNNAPIKPVNLKKGNFHYGAHKPNIQKKPLQPNKVQRFKVVNEQPEYAVKNGSVKKDFKFKNPYTQENY